MKLSALVNQVLASAEKAAAPPEEKICSCCKTAPRAISSKGALLTYCRSCGRIKAKEYRDKKRATTAVPESNR